MLVALPFLFLGSGLLLLGCYWAVLGKRATSWERVQGTVLAMKEIHGRIKGQSSSGLSVTYAYEYHGKSYEGNRLGFGVSGSDQLQRIQYGSGHGNVLVWVDPEKPNRSVLVPGVMSGAKVFITLGGVLASFIVYLLCSMRQRRVSSVGAAGKVVARDVRDNVGTVRLRGCKTRQK